ncbi:hypothetical protein [Erythrobacter mangrovi]|uniref:hypothetical protein n=1 Tax=Erythrobacter mangrovi TaxID=2739433 RepID=UPI001F24F590|nr:hypothetical protein [Erythrobacter mangrovi]
MVESMLNPYASRAEALRSKSPQLVGDFVLYATKDGGKHWPAWPGWGCLCRLGEGLDQPGYIAWPLLEEPLQPGDKRENVGFVFLSAEGADVMRNAGKFYLWDSGLIGEVSVVD